jgi:hypothetical protein
MSGLAHVIRVLVPDELFQRGHGMLNEIGRDEVEGLILWAGVREGDVFSVGAVLRPAQSCASTQDGLLVLVDGHELHRVGVWLYEQGMQLVAQVHSHPTEAYHSTTDDQIPIVTTEGGLSLVVPNFARGEATLDSYAVFRLDSTGFWNELSRTAATDLVQLVPAMSPNLGLTWL